MLEEDRRHLESCVQAREAERSDARRAARQTAKTEKKAWRQRTKEDEQYLKEHGVLNVFRDCAYTLYGVNPSSWWDRHTAPGLEWAQLVKPVYDSKQKETHINLTWDSLFDPETGKFERREILCFVVRENGRQQGVKMSGIEEVLPVDKEVLSKQVVIAIEIAQSKPRKVS